MNKKKTILLLLGVAIIGNLCLPTVSVYANSTAHDYTVAYDTLSADETLYSSESYGATSTNSSEYGGLELSDWQYDVSDSYYTLRRYIGNSNKVSIPGKINGKAVKFLGMGQGGLFPNPKRSQITHIKTVEIEGVKPKCIGTLERAFQYMSNLEYVDLSNSDVPSPVGGDKIDSMFYECKNLREVNLSGVNLSKVNSAERAFEGCTNLKIIEGLETCDVSKIESFKYMFSGCKSLEAIDLSSWQIDSLTNTQFMFDNCTSLKNVTLPDFSTATNFKSSAYMFYQCTSLTNIDLGNFTAPNLSSIQSMFEGCSGLQEVDLTPLKTSNLKVLTSVFQDCISLAKVNMPIITDATYHASSMFYNCPSLNFIDLRNFDSSGISEENFQENFYVDESESDDKKKLLILATDEKLVNYNYTADGRIGSGPIMNANGGIFSDDKDVHKINNIFVLPNIDQSSIDTAIENAIKTHEIPVKINHTFESWDRITADPISTNKYIDAESIETAFNLLNKDEYMAKWSTEISIINNPPTINATDKVLTVGDTFNPLDGVTAFDDGDGDITLTEANIIANNVNMDKAGTYSVTYKVTDSQGAATVKTITVTVNEKTDDMSSNPMDSSDTDSSASTQNTSKLDGPKTGDAMNPGLLTLMVAGSGGILFGLIHRKRRNQKK